MTRAFEAALKNLGIGRHSRPSSAGSEAAHYPVFYPGSADATVVSTGSLGRELPRHGGGGSERSASSSSSGEGEAVPGEGEAVPGEGDVPTGPVLSGSHAAAESNPMEQTHS